jgi:hypothetical protein
MVITTIRGYTLYFLNQRIARASQNPTVPARENTTTPATEDVPTALENLNVQSRNFSFLEA